jgi:hypothetical protein
MTTRCVVCGRETERPISDALSHFKLYQHGYWQYLRGNIKTFGLRDGITGTLGLAFPIYNTIRNWKYRKYRLVLPPEVTR